MPNQTNNPKRRQTTARRAACEAGCRCGRCETAREIAEHQAANSWRLDRPVMTLWRMWEGA
jgi:hypothetical protein